MSVMYCDRCDKQIDTDYNAEHFTDNGDCYEGRIEQLNDEIGVYLDDNTTLNNDIKQDIIDSTIELMDNGYNMDNCFKKYIMKILQDKNLSITIK